MKFENFYYWKKRLKRKNVKIITLKKKGQINRKLKKSLLYDVKLELNNSKICISTQAAEKIYSGYGYPARVENKVIVDDSSTLFWMPQELILFNNSKLERNSYFDLKTNSNLFICETIIFGRRSMNENIENILKFLPNQILQENIL